jgi:hypothetical protein
MKFSLLAMFIFALPSYSQVTLSVFAGVSPSTNILDNESDFFSSYCNPGFATGLSSELYVSPTIAICPSIEFANYAYDEKTSYIVTTIPERRVKSTSADNSHLWRFLVEISQLTNPEKTIRLHLSTGVGYVLERPGLITATFEDMNGPSFTETFKHDARKYFVHALTLGAQWALLPALALDLRAQLLSNYSDRMSTIVALGVVYTVAE